MIAVLTSNASGAGRKEGRTKLPNYQIFGNGVDCDFEVVTDAGPMPGRCLQDFDHPGANPLSPQFGNLVIWSNRGNRNRERA
jgi:hypothetical protein